MATASFSLGPLHDAFSFPNYPQLVRNSRFRPHLRYSSNGFPSITTRASSTFTLEPVLYFFLSQNLLYFEQLYFLGIWKWILISNFKFEGDKKSAKSKFRAFCMPCVLWTADKERSSGSQPVSFGNIIINSVFFLHFHFSWSSGFY